LEEEQANDLNLEVNLPYQLPTPCEEEVAKLDITAPEL
jgi:hypothetical protein